MLGAELGFKGGWRDSTEDGLEDGWLLGFELTMTSSSALKID